VTPGRMARRGKIEEHEVATDGVPRQDPEVRGLRL
jgi:hypothetical protein